MGRCKITNGTKMPAGVDGRSHIDRRLRDIVNGLLIEFPVTGEADLAQLKNTATLMIINEPVQAKVAHGEVADIPMITNLAGQLRRNLSDLRSRTWQRGPVPSSIHEHLSLYGTRLNDQEDDEDEDRLLFPGSA
jgi:hypothetical protein